MKKITAIICVHLCLVFLVFSINAQEFKQVQDGIEYAEMTRTIDKLPVKMNLLRLDLTKVRLDVVHAMDAAIGTETVSSMAKRHGAIAAINAGFFRLDKSIFAGDAAGVLQIDGKLLSEPHSNRIALMISNQKDKTKVEFQHLTLYSNNVFIGKDGFKIGGKIGERFEIKGMNRERKEGDLIIFTPQFHKTTLTNSNGLEIIVRDGKITQIIDNKGNNNIPADGFVISADEKVKGEILKKIKVGYKVGQLYSFDDINTGRISGKDISWEHAEDITNGVPQLIKNGKIEITWEQEKASKSFVENKHPRTAVAKLKDGKFLMITVDGRSEQSAGIGLQNLSEILIELGAADAMNLDGGGSTTMFLDGKIVNQPSDQTGERKVGDAILVTPRKKK